MYGFLFRPKWIGFHLLVIGGIAAMINFGFWQLDRLDERREFNAKILERTDLAVTPLDDLLTGGGARDDLEQIEWRSTIATGRYLPEEQFVVVNRSQNGRPGDNVVTPMELADGRILVVNRGFVPLGFEVPEAPDGTVRIEGLVRNSQDRRTGQLSDPAEGRLTQVQRIDLDRIAPQLPGQVLPVYVDLLVSSPAEPPNIPEPVIRPDLSEGSHLSYAVQWFIFAVAVGVGWVLAVRRSIERHRADMSGSVADGSIIEIPASGDTVTDGSAATTSTDPPSSGAGERATAPS